MTEMPRPAARALVALGVLAVVALPALTGVFAWRLGNGFGVSLAADEVRLQPLENATRVAVHVNAFRADPSQDVSFRGGSGTLFVDGLETPLESATGRSTCSAEGCFRGLVFTFLLPEGAFRGDWRLEVRTEWRSETFGRVTSWRTDEFRGVGERVA